MRILLAIILCSLFIACNQEVNSNPKPRSFPKIEYPKQNYIDFDADYCSFEFTHPDYMRIVKEKAFFEDSPVDECWFDLQMDDLNGALHCSYIPLKNREQFDKMVDDAYKLVSEHNYKANHRDDYPIVKGDVTGMIFELEGEVASKLQFYLTDSTDHFFRASLYFDAKVNSDSIAPIYNFVKGDVIKMIESFEWTK